MSKCSTTADMSLPEAANALAMPYGTVYDMLRVGRLQAYRPHGGGRWRVPAEEVERIRQERERTHEFG